MLVIPYFAYARQHKRYLNFEAISAKTVAKIISNFGVKKIIVFDIHDEAVLKFFKVKAVNLSAYSLIAEHYKKLKNPFILIPD